MIISQREKELGIVSCWLVVILLPLFLFVIPGQAASQSINLKVSSVAGRDMPVSLANEAWANEIEKRTNGRVKFEFFWGASLLKPPEQMKGTGAGLVDVSLGMPAYDPSATPLATIGDLGYITSKVDAAARALNDLYEMLPYFKNELEQYNVKVLFFIPFPPTILGSYSPIRSLEDLKGKKIRALGLLNHVINRLGGVPVGIPLPEVYEALSRKVVDGLTSMPLSSVPGYKFHEVAKYYLDFGYGSYAIQYVCINRDKWESLPVDIREIIEEVSARGIDIYVDALVKSEQEYIEPLKTAGCSFYTLPYEEVSRWKNTVVPAIWNDWIEKHKKDGPSKEFFDLFVERVRYHEPRSTYTQSFPR